jgi:hypothetical protein
LLQEKVERQIMKTDRLNVGACIRRLAWAAPVLAAWQTGCIGGDDDKHVESSCSNFQPERLHVPVPLESTDAGQPPSTPEQCQAFCLEGTGQFSQNFTCEIGTGDGGLVVVCSYNTLCVGRRRAGFEPPALDHRGALLGRYFAAMAAAEAASVDAFEQLARELELHGEPELGRRARRAAVDEERHHRMAAALARKFGVSGQRGSVRIPSARSLLDLAVDNVREGLVVETFGAAVGFWQAAHAGDPRVRRMMERIAADETEHAVLSWDVDAALRARLSAGERAELDNVMIMALSAFEAEVGASPPAELVRRAGLPSRQVAAAMFDEARKALYS